MKVATDYDVPIQICTTENKIFCQAVMKKLQSDQQTESCGYRWSTTKYNYYIWK